MNALNETGRRFVIDTHLLDSPGVDVEALRAFHEAGKLELAVTDVLGTEISAAGPTKRVELEKLAENYVEILGPLLVGHSRLASSVTGSTQDEERLNEVFAFLFPNVAMNVARKQHVRDALHISTAIRYGFDAFITNDRMLLRAQGQVVAQFGVDVMTPSRARAFIERLLEKGSPSARSGGSC